MAAVSALHGGVAEFVNQDGGKYHGDPNQDILRVSVFAAHSEKYGCDPKEWVYPNRDAEHPEVQVGLCRWWFAEEHLGGLRIADLGLRIALFNPQTAIRNPKSLPRW